MPFFDKLNPAFAAACDEEWVFMDDECLHGSTEQQLFEAARDWVYVYCMC